MEKVVLDDLSLLSNHRKAETLLFLEMNRRRIKDFAGDGLIVESFSRIETGHGQAETINHYLRRKMNADKEIYRLCIASPDGKIVVSTDDSWMGADISHEAFFQKGKELPSETEIVIENGEPGLVFSAPLYELNSNRPIGVIVGFVPIAELGNTFSGNIGKDFVHLLSSPNRQKKTMDFYIVNKDRLMITESSYIKNPRLKKVDTEPVRMCLESASEMSGFYKDYRGIEVAGASICIPSLKWTMVAEIDRSEGMEPLFRTARLSLITVVVVVGTVFLLFIFLSRMILNQISELSAAAKEVASGNYNINIKIRSRDEIGSLLESFNTMILKIMERDTALRQSRESLANAQRIAGMGNWDWDIKSGSLRWSEETYRIFGLEPDQISPSYDTFLNLTHPEDRESVNKEIFDSVYSGKPYSVDHRIVLSDNSIKFVREQGEVVRDENGKSVKMSGTVQDITKKRAAELALQESEEKYHNIFETSKDVILISDFEGTILDVNPAGVELLGFASKDELTGKKVNDLYADCNEMEECRLEVMNNLFIRDREVVFRRQDGQKIIGLLSASLIKIRGTQTIAGIFRDVTAHKRLEQQLFQAQKMEAIGLLAGGIAHDFNNIITAIFGFGKLLLRKINSDDPLMEYVEPIILASEKAENLTHSLLAFGRRQIFSTAPVSLDHLINNIEKLLSRIIGEDIDLIVVKTENITILANSGQIEQVLMNLATNARDAMPNGGSLIIRTEKFTLDESFILEHGFGKTGEYALIKVTDTGCGMDEETKMKIFDPFFTTKEVGKGSGLGLSIVYGIVKQHNGHIIVSSEPGQGTEFRIYLPVVESDAIEDIIEEEYSTGGREKILIVEDDALVRRYCKTLLESSGYEVIEASNGNTAVELLKENIDDVDLAIIDVIMPEKNGREVWDELKKIKDIKTLFMSGYTDDVIFKKGALEEEVNFISKPIDPYILLKKIRHTLDGNDICSYGRPQK